MTEENYYQYALCEIKGIGDATIKKLIRIYGSAQEVFIASKKKQFAASGIQLILEEKIASFNNLDHCKKQFDLCNSKDIHIVFHNEIDFPERLNHFNDSPCRLFYKGDLSVVNKRSVAVVGTRNATDYGKNKTNEIVQDLVPHDPVIISGLAYGIDFQAHKAALEASLSTIAVMGCGLDSTYPAKHKKIAEQIQEHGVCISEFPLASPPLPFHFPARNRIIAGLSDAVVVVEAAKKGGALITAEIANSYDKSVFCVPGNCDQLYSIGCNHLIKTHQAGLICSGNDIAYAMGWETNAPPVTIKKIDPLKEEDFTIAEWKIIQLLQENPKGIMIDEMAWRTQINISDLSSNLLTLEFRNILFALPGKKYRLKAI